MVDKLKSTEAHIPTPFIPAVYTCWRT